MRDDSGASLIDTLASVSLISLAVVGVLGALGAAASGSLAEERMVTADALLGSFEESLRTAAVYVPCASPAEYSPSSLDLSVPAGYSVEVTAVEVWDGSTRPGGFSSAPGDCDLLSDRGVQRLTVEASAAGSSAPPRVLSFVWRHP